MKIYTRTGDAGQTGLLGGGRVPKDSARMEAIGAVDELNAHLGICRVHAEGNVLSAPLEQVQSWLFEIGAEIATPRESKYYKESVQKEEIEYLEHSMDQQNEVLSPLRNFILPGGTSLAAHLHLTRTVCRRTERYILQFHREEEVRQEVRIFFNRLSDWLFMAARTANHIAGVDDVKWSRVS